MEELNKEEYNSIPVFYCKKCLSLRIMNLVGLPDFDYCDECGATDIAQVHIEDWRKLYKNRYGFDFMEK